MVAWDSQSGASAATLVAYGTVPASVPCQAFQARAVSTLVKPSATLAFIVDLSSCHPTASSRKHGRIDIRWRPGNQ